jgi:hypothetical protein
VSQGLRGLEEQPDSIVFGHAPLARILVDTRVRLALVAAICGISFWFNLGGTALWDPDEGRHAEIAREMLASGRWLTPTLNGQPYHDKPVLFYWLTALSMHAFGQNAWAARLPSAITATTGVLLTAWWGTRFVGPLTGTVGALMLATTGLYVALGRLTMLDMAFSFWLSAALLYGSAWGLGGRSHVWPVWPVYALVALAVLTKGPVALVLATLTLGVFTYRTGIPVREWRIGQGVLVFGLIAGSWYLAAAIVEPTYMRDFLWIQNVGRFTHGRVGHPLSVLAYAYLLPLGFLPWSFYWPLAAYTLRERGWRAPSPAIEFCLVWIAVTLIFFSISSAKLATYVLPVFPPLAIVTAAWLGEALRGAVPPTRELGYRIVFHVLEALCAGLGVAAIVMGLRFWPDAVLAGLVPLLLAVPLPLILGHMLVRRERYALLVPMTFLLMVAILVGFYGWFAPRLNHVFSLEPAAALTRYLPPERRVFTFDSPPGSLSFYIKDPVQRLATAAEVRDRLSETQPTAVVMKRKRLAELAAVMTSPAFVWWEGTRVKALVVNRPPPPESGIAVVSLQKSRQSAVSGGQ